MKLRSLAIALLLGGAIALSGCSTGPVAPPKVVYVRVAAKQAEPPVVKRPKLPVNLLTAKDKGHYDRIAKAYALSIDIQKKLIDQLIIYLDAYRHPKATKPTHHKP